MITKENKKYNTALFIFHRDMRLEDNTGLIRALKESKKVMAAFIFDPRQVEKNTFRSDNSVRFMLESLADLKEQLQARGGRMYYYYGLTHEIVGKLINQEKLQAVFSNRDYTPFSIHRDLAVKDACERSDVAFIHCPDYLLNEPETVEKKDGGVYTVYSPFYKKASMLAVAPVTRNTYKNYHAGPVKNSLNGIPKHVLSRDNPKAYVRGGRKHALKILKAIAAFEDYDERRNIPSIKGTTGLSAHNKFGTVSIREVYHAVAGTLGRDHTLIRELYWRDFFTHIGFHYSHVLGGAFYEKYDLISWKNDRKQFKAWCEGRTGFPIVDAGMRELNTTGFMHNRVRMIVASFLVKDLHIDWQWGEKYFARNLIDYDPLVNNGNWQWAASTGCDAQPYFRIFNPWRQQERYDPECTYVKKWIGELRPLSPKEIHRWYEGEKWDEIGYPQPIVEHSVQSNVAKSMFKNLYV